LLTPNRAVFVVTNTGVVELIEQQITVEAVGQKAFGLLTLPRHWTPPFFVVIEQALAGSDSDDKIQAFLQDASARARVNANRLLVRSNGIEEGLLQRGSLVSSGCQRSDLKRTLLTLRSVALGVTESPTHWIVQNEVAAHALGQLSNERRVRYEKRDWAIEVEAMHGSIAYQSRMGVRRWRDGDDATTETSLGCRSTLEISLALRRVAMWAGQDKRRFLFEWVWDGNVVHVVQMDLAITTGGENPKKLLPLSVPSNAVPALTRFVLVEAEHKNRLRKLGNTALYEELGYTMPAFYVLEDQQELKRIVQEGVVSSELLADLKVLTTRPLVLRTDGLNLPQEKREMLPRSEELRSGEAAVDWLINSFRPTILKLGLADAALALIGHHFIPSVASAWAGAEPGKRWVRIEALWGIPESLYWHSHDTYEVDCENADLSKSSAQGCNYPLRSRERFKGTFIAPDSSGAWVHHQTAIPFDWSPTISSRQWLCEIAHTTRRICERLQKPVEVMWFVDTHPESSDHRLLPWYHSIPDNTDTPIGAPRKKIKSSQERYIRDRKDWSAFQEVVKTPVKIERVIVEPHDPELVRNPTFAEELGSLAQQHGIVVVLAGGILSHAYHALRRAGASVECIDLFGATEDKAEYNKLVRDKVPAQIADRGESFEIVRLKGEALMIALRRKLVEEALEALDANAGTDLIGELADVLEVVRAISKAIQTSSQQLEEERSRKLKKRGGFDEGFMLLTTASPHSLARSSSTDSLLTVVKDEQVRTISDPSAVPQKAVYKRPDHRNLSGITEELLVVETELNRLGTLVESINFELPSNVDARQYTSSIELSRSGSELRAAVRLQSRKRKVESDVQSSFNFGEV
jgi:predicted house-cleaning noncanonical NTP pyrophosphatase (MazG superfamily)